MTIPVDLSKDYTPPDYPKSESETLFIRKALTDNFVFSSLSKNNIKTLIGSMEKVEYEADAIIIAQGDVISEYFYIVAQGVVNFIVDGKNVGQCGSGGSFGELALLYNCPRAATCESETDVTLYKLDQHTFRYIVAATTSRENSDLNDKLSKMPNFSQLDDFTRTRLIDLFTTVSFGEDEVLFRKDDPGEVMYILNKGSVLLTDIGSGKSKYNDVVIKPGEAFGELAILTKDGTRQATATAIEAQTEAFCLSRYDFEQVFDNLDEVTILCQKRHVLNSVSLFASVELQPHEHRKLMKLFQRQSYKKGHVLVASGQPCLQSIYFIHEGKVMDSLDSGVIKNLVAGDYFGDKFIQKDAETKSTEEIVMEEDTVCFTLSKEDMISVLGSDRIQKGRFTIKYTFYFPLISS